MSVGGVACNNKSIHKVHMVCFFLVQIENLLPPTLAPECPESGVPYPTGWTFGTGPECPGIGSKPKFRDGNVSRHSKL